MSRHTLSVLVEDKPGVLARVASLFSRRGFNIESLAVGPTEVPEVSRMTIVVNVDQLPLDGLSFLDTFSRENSPEPHRVQYFEMGGFRAIYQDGWLASAAPSFKAGDPQHDFSQDRWELYDLTTDFSQARDVT